MLKTEQFAPIPEPESPSAHSDLHSQKAAPKRSWSRLAYWGIVTLLLVCVVIVSSLRWWAWPELQRWQPQVEQQLSKILGVKVTVGNLEPGFNGFYPSVVATNLETEGGALSLGRVEIEFSPRALLARQILFRHLVVDSGQVRIDVDEKGLWHLGGLVFDPADKSVMDEASQKKVSEAARWIFSQHRLQINNVDVMLVNKAVPRRDRLKIEEIKLENSGRRHSFKVASSLGGVFEARWKHHLGMHADLAEQWVGDLNWTLGANRDALSGEQLSYLLRSAGAVTNAPLLDQISALTFAGQVTASFEKGIINTAQIRGVSVSSSTLLSTATSPLVSLKRTLGQDFELQTQDLAVYGHEALSGLKFAINGPSNIQFHWGGEIAGEDFATLHAAKIQVGALDVASVSNALRHWAAAQSLLDLKPLLTQSGLKQWQLSGQVRGAKFTWNQARDELAGELDAEQLSLLGRVKTDTLPGFERIGGKITFEKLPENGDFIGSYEVTGDQARLMLPSVFTENEVKFTKLGGTGKWHWFRDFKEQPDDVFELNVDKLNFSNADISGSLRGVYRASRRAQKPGYADISGQFEKASGIRIASYLPLRIPELTRSWVARAIKAGDATDGNFKLKGDLWNFPFKESGTGDFQISAKVKNAQFAFAPNWAEIENLNGEFLLDRTSIRVNGKTATVLGVAVSDVVVDLPDLKAGIVKVSGKAEGSMASILNFVNTSPLKRLTVQSESAGVQAFTKSLDIQGPAKLALTFDLPIFDYTGIKLQGLLSVANARLSSIHTPDLRNVEGSLAFTEKTLELKSLTGQYGDNALGENHPLSIAGVSDSSMPLSLKISGVATAKALKKLPLLESIVPILQSFHGATPFDSVVEVNREAFQVQVQSSLAGMALDLPAPVGKTAEQTRGFRLSFTPTQIIAGLKSVPDVPQVELKLARPGVEKRHEWVGGLNIGRLPDEPLAESKEGLSAVVKTDSLDLKLWRKWLLQTYPSETSTTPTKESFIGNPSFVLDGSPVKLNHLAMSVNRLTLDQLVLQSPVIGASLSWATNELARLSQWQASVSSSNANGFVTWRDGQGQEAGKVTARLATLKWPLSDQENEKINVVDTSTVDKSTVVDRQSLTALPSLDVVSDDFTLRGNHLGKLIIAADASRPEVYKVSEFSFTLPELSLNAIGDWNKKDNVSRFDVSAKTSDAGALLSLAGQPGVLKSGPGELKGAVDWAGNVDAFSFDGLNGEVALALGKGQFLKTDVGAAKMLGILSVQGLVRRLNLDFRDVASEGFAFDSIAGPIKITRGIAAPDDVLIKSPIAQISLKGQLNIALRTQDLTLKVVPEVNAGAASLAYAAWVNPAIGLGSFIFQWALRKPLQSIFTTEYRVSGQWDQPLIKGLDRKLSQYGIVSTE
jgi:uncharacterized protein (TIGR02099 family)